MNKITYKQAEINSSMPAEFEKSNFTPKKIPWDFFYLNLSFSKCSQKATLVGMSTCFTCKLKTGDTTFITSRMKMSLN